jgi:hypothetical protein
MTSAANTSSAVAAGAVRAEMARQQKTIDELALVIGREHRAARKRWKGIVSFTIDEIGDVADWLGVDKALLLGERVAV